MSYKIDCKGLFKSVLSSFWSIVNLVCASWLFSWGLEEYNKEAFYTEKYNSSGEPALFISSIWILLVVLHWVLTKKNTFLFRQLEPQYKGTIRKYFKFYQTLNREEKKFFELRVQRFISFKDFVPRGELSRVTAEMKALIAGTAIQITFGYPEVYFEHFEQILIYHDNYYSNITEQYHQGEVNMRGIIVLSWVNFVKGFADHTDGRNLGYHEMAHALKLENAVRNGEYDFIDFDLIKELESKSNIEVAKILNGEPSFFREYAATNNHEFFAVMVENFFERPKEFQEGNPDLYRLATRILKQDPLKM